MMKVRRLVLTAAACSAALGLPSLATAQSYPTRPIKMIVAYGAGSGADIVARILAEKLGEQLKVNVFVENRDGAGGAIGTAAAARSTPDGYTLLLAPTTLTVSPAMMSAGYDVIKDFTPVTKVAVLPMTVITAPEAPFKTFSELVAYARANPGKLFYATSGKGSPSHLEMELLKQRFGIDVRDIPYKNFAQALTDLTSGQVSFYLPVFPAALPHIKSGRVRALVTGAPQRSSQAPEVPTLAEAANLPGYQMSVWYGVVAPAGTPKDIVDRINKEVLEALASPQVRSKIEGTGAVVTPQGTDQFAPFVHAEAQKWGKLVRDLKLKATD
jgi:tripartite-type tricarboxylate transporter receptor subunit TctC